MVIELTVSDAHLVNSDAVACMRIDSQGTYPTIETWYEQSGNMDHVCILLLDEKNIIRIIDTLKDVLNEMKKENK